MKTRFYTIDFLRFFAAFMVMIYHYMLNIPNSKLLPISFGFAGDLTAYNYLAVNLFFVISGFVIIQSADGANASKFLKSRITRLYPVYWVCCTISFALTYLFINDLLHLSIARYLLNMTMLNGFFGIGYVDNVYWTLFIELKFYLLILVVLLLNKSHLIEAVMRGWLAISAICYLLSYDLFTTMISANFAAFFVAGCTIYQAKKYGWNFFRGTTLISAYILGCLFEFENGIVKSNHYHLELSSMTIALILAAIFLILWMSTKINITNNHCQHVSAFLGRLSYPLYLIHFNVGLLLLYFFVTEQNKWQILVLICAAMTLFAYILNKHVEQPLSKKLKLSLDKFYLSSS